MTNPTKADWQARQRRLNIFAKNCLKGVGPIREDGDPGPATHKRIRQAKFWLGWLDKNINGGWTDGLHQALLFPNRQPKEVTARGNKRRRAHNLAWLKSHAKVGVTSYDGVRVARWMVPYLEWARAHGWRGRLVSGYRDPAYSEKLCFHMCGKPTCPGRCAGKTSHHVGSKKPLGALDVTFYDDFGHLMARCPYTPRLFNSLPMDRVHYSATGN